MATSAPVTTLAGLSSVTVSPPTTTSSLIPMASGSPTTSPPTTTTGNVKYGLKIIHMHYCVSRVVLYKVFRLGTPHKDPSEDIITYLDNLPPTSTVNYVTVTGKQRSLCKFDATQKKMVIQSTSGEEFDVTLLCHCIKVACEGVAGLNDPAWWTDGPKLENCIYMIKKRRNEAMHESLKITKAEFQRREKDLRQLLINTISALQQQYPHSMTTKDRDYLIQEIKDKLDSIRDGNYMLHELRQECQEELKTRLQSMLHFNPVSFILGSSLALDVTLVFTDIEIVHGVHGRAYVVSYQDFLFEIDKVPGRRVVLLEGVAGSGKTTLVTLMLQEWCTGHGTIKKLDSYDVVVHVVCRDPSTDNYELLVKKFLPKTFTLFNKFTQPLLAQCRLLVLIDGLDESTKASSNLVKDVLHQLNGVDATIICTSRPERSIDFQNMAGSSTPVIHTCIMGIPENKRLEFVEKNHRVLQQQTCSGRDTDQLVQLMKEKVKLEHFRIPLNLLLSTWLWDQDPDALGNTTTQTELYFHTHRLSKMKLQQRLSNHSKTSEMNHAAISDLVYNWEIMLYKELLVALSLNQLVLTREAVKRLWSKAETRDLPAEEMLGAFLTLKCVKTGLQQYSAPHKGLQDYYAALHIVEALKEHHQSQVGHTSSFIRHVRRRWMKNFKIREVLENAIGDITEVKKYQNVFQHVAGLVHLHMDPVPNHLVVEVVELLRDAGVRHREQWLDLVEDTKASPAVLAAISRIALPFQGIVSSFSGLFSHPSVTVKDGRVIAYSTLLPHLSPTEVRISIDGEPPSLAPLVDSLAHHTYTVELWDLWYYPNPAYIPEPSIQTLLSREGMVTFKGQWASGMENMSSALSYLSLSVADETQAAKLVPLLHSLPLLKYLEMHIPPSVSPSGLTSALPEVPATGTIIQSTWAMMGFIRPPGVHLYQTDLRPGGESRACKVVARLHPPNMYGWLYFPDATLGPEEWKLMLGTLSALGVRTRGIKAPGPSTSEDTNLDTLARTHLQGGRFERQVLPSSTHQ